METCVENNYLNVQTYTICRICRISGGVMNPLYEENTTIMIALCTGLEISKHDGFSEVICNSCVDAVKSAFEFRNKCWESQTLFLNELKDHTEYEGSKFDYREFKKEPSIEIDEVVLDKKDADLNEKLPLYSSPPISNNSSNDNLSNLQGPKCSRCDIIFYDESELQNHDCGHIQIQLESGIHTTCTICSETVQTIQMIEHIQLMHKELITADIFRQPEFHSQPQLHYPMIDHNAIKTVPKPKIKRTYKLQCKLCEYVTCQRNLLARHMQEVHRKKNYICVICRFVAPTSREIYKHKITMHADRLFCCEICNQSFKSKYLLDQHNDIHGTELKYDCTICQKKFLTKFALKEHKAEHNPKRRYYPSKLYECDACPEKFKFHAAMRYHQMKNHGWKKCPTYQCPRCNSGFVKKYAFRKHMMYFHKIKIENE